MAAAAGNWFAAHGCTRWIPASSATSAAGRTSGLQTAGRFGKNLVLDELLTAIPQSRVHYWRDGAGHEVDFAIVAGRDRVAAVEAKISPDAFNAKALARFRRAYPDGPNLLCCPFVDEPFQRRFGGFEVMVCAPWQVPECIRG